MIYFSFYISNSYHHWCTLFTLNLSITIDPQESKAQAMRTRRANNQAHERAWVRAARSRHKRNQRKHGKTFYSGNVIIRKCSAKRITVQVERAWARSSSNDARKLAHGVRNYQRPSLMRYCCRTGMGHPLIGPRNETTGHNG